jgi:1-aminocyclopropane-1-carboxylate deaminase
MQPDSNHSLELACDYHFGGYGKTNQTLLDFIRWFSETHNILLDPLYTGKMMFGMYDLMNKGVFPSHATVMAIHTGGLQGWDGMKFMQRKNLET